MDLHLDAEGLETLSRRELQTLAKKHGIKANSKSSTIILSLKELLLRGSQGTQHSVECSTPTSPVTTRPANENITNVCHHDPKVETGVLPGPFVPNSSSTNSIEGGDLDAVGDSGDDSLRDSCIDSAIEFDTSNSVSSEMSATAKDEMELDTDRTEVLSAKITEKSKGMNQKRESEQQEALVSSSNVALADETDGETTFVSSPKKGTAIFSQSTESETRNLSNMCDPDDSGKIKPKTVSRDTQLCIQEASHVEMENTPNKHVLEENAPIEQKVPLGSAENYSLNANETDAEDIRNDEQSIMDLINSRLAAKGVTANLSQTLTGSAAGEPGKIPGRWAHAIASASTGIPRIAAPAPKNKFERIFERNRRQEKSFAQIDAAKAARQKKIFRTKSPVSAHLYQPRAARTAPKKNMYKSKQPQTPSSGESRTKPTPQPRHTAPYVSTMMKGAGEVLASKAKLSRTPKNIMARRVTPPEAKKSTSQKFDLQASLAKGKKPWQQGNNSKKRQPLQSMQNAQNRRGTSKNISKTPGAQDNTPRGIPSAVA
eukprot:m.273062 g.273062  ORF g.273062 m.273062 type:complete len:543 (-) comp19751_c0_seq2:395-2023(-)